MKRVISLILFLVSGLTVEVANADFTFDEPTNLGPPIWQPGHDPQGCCFSRDGLELYFTSTRSPRYGGWDIWVATRETIDAPWTEPVNLGPNVNSSAEEIAPSISPNGLELYFTLYHDYNIRVCSRPSKDTPWSNPELLGPPVGGHRDQYPEVSADGLSLYFESNRPGGLGGWDIWVSTRATTSDPWSEPINLGPNVNSGSGDGDPSISSDGLALFFISNRPGGSGTWDLWVTTRPTRDAEWGPPVNYPSLNSSGQDFHPAISPDGSVLYFESPHALWQSTITPIVDLNGDGIVDAADMCIIVDHWGTGNSLCDIGPMPWGDGIVDVQDLIVLAEHLFEGFGDTVIEQRISAGTDDAEEAVNDGFQDTYNTSSDLEILDDHSDNGGRQFIGMNFRDIDIPPGSQISNAYIEFVCDETKDGEADAYLLLWGHLAANPDGFADPTRTMISDRPRTQAKVPWEPEPWTAVGQVSQTADISSIIQELIDQEGWAACNAIEIMIGEDTSKPAFTGSRCAESYNGDSSNAPLLHIEIVVP